MVKFSAVIDFMAVLSFARFVNGMSSFYVENSGHTKPRPGQIAVTFYMTIANGGSREIRVSSKNINCCWAHNGVMEDLDCETMEIIGGMPIKLGPSKTANVTYIFTNMYPLDRVGRCIFHLWHSDEKIAHTIRFNTTYAVEETWLKSLYKKVSGDVDKYGKCATVDLDKYRKCKPVNCVQKYDGKRSYFRKTTRLCEPVHECRTLVDEENLPTTAFDIDHNRCKSLLQKQLTKEEEAKMRIDAKNDLEDESGKVHVEGVGSVDIECNHGKRVGRICVCDDGWMTDASMVTQGDTSFVYSWCNVKTRKRPYLTYKHQKRLMIAGLSLTVASLAMAWFWVIYRYVYESDADREKRQGVSRRVYSLATTDKLIETLTSETKRRESESMKLSEIAGAFGPDSAAAVNDGASTSRMPSQRKKRVKVKLPMKRTPEGGDPIAGKQANKVPSIGEIIDAQKVSDDSIMSRVRRASAAASAAAQLDPLEPGVYVSKEQLISTALRSRVSLPGTVRIRDGRSTPGIETPNYRTAVDPATDTALTDRVVEEFDDALQNAIAENDSGRQAKSPNDNIGGQNLSDSE